MNIIDYMSKNLCGFYNDDGISLFDRNDSIPRELVEIEKLVKKHAEK